MKSSLAVALAILLFHSISSLVAAETSTTGKTTAEVPKATAGTGETARTESPLVRASRKSDPTRPKAKIKIDNSDVKKNSVKSSGAKYVERPLPKATETNSAPKQDPAANAAAKQVLRDKTLKAQADVEALEKELRRLENDYYHEDDANYRDEVIQQRFETAKKQLDSAREKLAAARALEESVQRLAPDP